MSYSQSTNYSQSNTGLSNSLTLTFHSHSITDNSSGSVVARQGWDDNSSGSVVARQGWDRSIDDDLAALARAIRCRALPYGMRRFLEQSHLAGAAGEALKVRLITRHVLGEERRVRREREPGLPQVERPKWMWPPAIRS